MSRRRILGFGSGLRFSLPKPFYGKVLGGGSGPSLPDLSTPVLDQFPGAAIAISSRRLYTGQTRAIRVRRTSDSQTFIPPFLANGDLNRAAITAFCGASQGTIASFFDDLNGVEYSQSAANSQLFFYSGNGNFVESSSGRISFLSGTLGTQVYTASTIPAALRSATAITALSVVDAFSTSGSTSFPAFQFFLADRNGPINAIESLTGSGLAGAAAGVREFLNGSLMQLGISTSDISLTAGEVAGLVYVAQKTGATAFKGNTETPFTIFSGGAAATDDVTPSRFPAQDYTELSARVNQQAQELIVYPNATVDRAAVLANQAAYFGFTP